MKKEEVIKWLMIMKANLNTFPEVSSEKKIEALAEAIRLLKNEQSEEPSCSEKPNKSEIPTSSTTKNDLGVDAVSREKVWYMITGGKYSDEDDEKFIDRLVNKLAELPSVIPIRPKGHWIYDKSFANWICSKCGETPKTIGYVGTGAFMAEHFKYCNHCGAEMDGVEEK